MILQTCPDCARQYNVRHLDPGARVRCVCDAEFCVEHLRDVRVRGRRCTNCGGPVGPDHVACPYCSAALDLGVVAHMPCPDCFAWIDEEANHCFKCGTEIEPQALPPIPAGKACPRCEGALLLRSLERFSLVECGDCHGLWLDPDVFQSVCHDAERKAVPDSPFARDVQRRAFEASFAYIPCLDCGELMQRRQYRHRARPTGVVLDVCRDHGLWLDAEELEAIVQAIRAGAPMRERPDPGDDLFGGRSAIGRPSRVRRPTCEPTETSVLEAVMSTIADILQGF